MIQRAGRMLTHFEPELVGWLMEAFDRIGVRVITAAAVTAIERNESGFSVYAERNGEPLRVDADLVVHAAGRGPALGRLNLEAANAETEGGRLKLNEFLQSVSNPAIYAAGDAARKGPPLTPVASHDGKVVAANLIDGNHRRPDHRGVPSVAFTLPAIAVVGLGEAEARQAGLELTVADGEIPEGVRVHLKLDTGMGRWGLSELTTPTVDVVGLMSHFASADCDAAFTELQVERFRAATAEHSYLTRHLANSAGALRYPSSRFDAARCGIALYGISPFGTDPADDGLEPALRWDSHLAQVRQLQPGQSTGYGRRFLAERQTWIGIVPVGYADGFRRGLTGTEVRVAGEPCRVVGTISMDAFAVELDRELPIGTPVTLLGPGVQAEAHARVAGTIAYELVTGISRSSERSCRVTLDT